MHQWQHRKDSPAKEAAPLLGVSMSHAFQRSTFRKSQTETLLSGNLNCNTNSAWAWRLLDNLTKHLEAVQG
jgi:hypothetical protein